jgi:hypothetical protein
MPTTSRWCGAVSFEATKWAWKVSGITSSQKLVLLKLADQAHKTTNECFPGIASMSEETALDPKTISAALKELEKHGLIVVSRAIGRSNRYRLPVKTTTKTGGGSTDETTTKNGSRPPSKAVDDHPQKRWPNLSSNQSSNSSEQFSKSVQRKAEDIWREVELLANDVSTAKERATPEANAAVDLIGGWHPNFRTAKPFDMHEIRTRLINAVSAERTA